ncbi:MAG: lamin tail domain-containing protein, partial [Verrucomicrobia bacterium]
SPLRIAEIMYNPPGGEAFEFIEIVNTSAVEVDLTDVSLDGVEFHFVRGMTLPGHGRLVLAADDDPAAFAARYPGVTPAGWFGGSLANGGERIELIAADGSLIESVDYDDEGGWPALADGGGHSLEVVDPLGDPDDPANWRASVQPGGSPGEPNPVPAVPPVRLNEIMADNQSAWEIGGGYPDWIELFNAGDAPVDLTGWSLTDGAADHRFVFPATVLGPGEYLTILAAAGAADGRLATGFGLNREGEFLELADADGRRVDAVSFGLLPADLGLGRVGAEGRWTLCDPTPDALNEPVELAPVTSLAVNELMPDPVPGEDDWVELYNRDAQHPVALQGLWVGTESRLAAVGLPSFVPPHGFVVLRADEKPGPQHLDLRLPASQGHVRLLDALGQEFDRVVYVRSYEGVSYGRLPDGEDDFAMFRGSVSPGRPNYVIEWQGPVLNEILARSRQPVPGGPTRPVDWIELHNPSDQAWDLAGFTLAVGRPDPGQWTFPDGSVIEPGGFLLVVADPDQPASTVWSEPLQLGRGLDGDGDAVYLLSPEGQVVDSVEFGPQIADRPIGRAPSLWALLVEPTPGAANASSDPTAAYTLLRINEWQAAGAGADWLELYNPADRPIALARLSLTDDPSLAGMQKYVFPPLSYIAPRSHLRLWADGRPEDGFDHLPFRLDALGEILRLYTVSGIVIDQQVLLEAPAAGSQGRFPDGADTVVDFPETPSPGTANHLPHPAIVINEVLAQTVPPLEDAIEVLNTGSTPVDLGGWWLSDDPERLFKYAVPEGTVLDPGAFLVLYEGQFNNPGVAAEPFALDGARAGRVFLSEVGADGTLTGYRAVAAWEPMAPGESWGRFPTSLGPAFGPLAARTFGRDQPADVAEFRLGRGAPNSTPKVGPVVISEIMYHPAGTPEKGEAPWLEFIELHNLTDNPVPLYAVEAGRTNGWRLEGAVEFEFGPITLPPRGWLLVTPEFPDAAALDRFRAVYGLAAEDLDRIVGPWRGRLADEGEELRLERPGSRVLGDDGRWRTPYWLVDRVDYRPMAPWPSAADGSGLSLQRRDLDGYGNDPVHWMPATPSPLAPADAGAGDLDGDGLPDEWEWRHGLNLASAEGPDGAAGDPDNDGLTNLEEFLRGADPRQPNLLFRRLWVQGNRVYLSFHAAAGRLYRVEYTDDLAHLEWKLLTHIGPRSESGEVQFWTSMRPEGRPRFYRLV